MDSSLIRRCALQFVALVLFFTQSPDVRAVLADEEYDSYWQQVAGLLADREYSSALEVVEDAEDESGFSRFRDQLQQDKNDIEALQGFASLVKREASQLKPGGKLKVGSSEYRVVSFKSDARGDRLTLEVPNSSQKSEKSLIDLDPKIWIAIAEPKLTTDGKDRYVMGIFLASVARGDRKTARQALNLAAEEKIPVRHWTERIDAEEKAKDEKQEARKQEQDDPILGTWRIVIGEGRRARVINLTIRPNGKTNQSKITWRKAGENRYALSLSNGGTAHVALGPAGEGLRGKTANGAKVAGLRQAKSK